MFLADLWRYAFALAITGLYFCLGFHAFGLAWADLLLTLAEAHY